MTGFVVVVENPEADPDVSVHGTDSVEVLELSSYPATSHCPHDEVPGYVESWLGLLARTDLPDDVRKIVEKLVKDTKERFSEDEWAGMLRSIALFGDGDDEVHGWITLIVEPPEGESTQYSAMTVIGDDSGGVLRLMTEVEANAVATAWATDQREGGRAVAVEVFHYDRCPLGAVGRCLGDHDAVT